MIRLKKKSRYIEHCGTSEYFKAILNVATFPLATWGSMQSAAIDPTLDLCTRYPLQLGGPRQCVIRSLSNTSTFGQHWESNPRPCNLESNALSTLSCASKNV